MSPLVLLTIMVSPLLAISARLDLLVLKLVTSLLLLPMSLLTKQTLLQLPQLH
jgi:hypothetical protein